MEFRSKSCKEERHQIESYSVGKVTPTSMKDLRCYSANYATYAHQLGKDVKVKKWKSTVSKVWSLNDPEMQRKKRVAGYKVYDAEGKMKGSLKKSFSWIKSTCTQAVHGWW
ncbi:hypothetical protein RIF29_27997 [Crotalaria pallida]|uniref:Uncharacterized protein n=1 Tax=Crotalaria pallida TaxID=3830 RepID=A0AAN9ESA6_CROPI